MYTVKMQYMFVPLPKIWRCEFKTLEEARAAVVDRYMQPEVQGYRIIDEQGKIVEGKGVCIIAENNS